mmetsp:Transcript_57412/g.136454  ORF Transcript_57412/g.136454 Transcript_57412/m.136454 type:complete len:443 (+) Transcript_57412:64-1392(+)
MGDSDDDMPPLVGEDGTQVAASIASEQNEAKQRPASGGETAAPSSAAAEQRGRNEERPTDNISSGTALPAGVTEEQALQAMAALQAAKATQEAAEAEAEPVAVSKAIVSAMQEADGPRKAFKEPDEVTVRMVKAITNDDFEECEDAIFQGADVDADCGGGMKAIHLAAIRGEMYLTELLLAHGADVNDRDANGNTPLLYACHFFKAHKRGVPIVSQLLYHKADPYYRVREGKFAQQCAYDIIEKACHEPYINENEPRQMRALLQLAMDGTDAGIDAIAKTWMSVKSGDTKLMQVSSRKDKFEYGISSVPWVTPSNAKNAEPVLPRQLETTSEPIREEGFENIKDYSFTDEGEKVKVYIQFPEEVDNKALAEPSALHVSFDLQAFDVQLRTTSKKYRLRIDPLFGTIEVDQCKHRVSATSRKVTLTLPKRHKGRLWSAVQKSR